MLLVLLFVAQVLCAQQQLQYNVQSINNFPTDIGFEGPTATGSSPFLAQTDNAAVKFGSPTKDHLLPNPIETDLMKDSHDILKYFATIAPYGTDFDGFGVYEYGLPAQCKIRQVHLVSRHGSRYPLSLNKSRTLVKLRHIANSAHIEATGELQFLKTWRYNQGYGILTSLGHQQLFNKGINMFFRYGSLINDWIAQTHRKLVVRSTSQSRMKDTALYFLNGLFGLDWQQKANLELIIEASGYNNTLASSRSCPNLHKNTLQHKTQRRLISKFVEQNFRAASDRLNSQIKYHGSSNHTLFHPSDMLRLQDMCTYETNNLGYSQFCSLFTRKEWENYGYVKDWQYYLSLSFPSNTVKALGIGWVEEFRNRLKKRSVDLSRVASQNITLNNNSEFFPLDLPFYADFSHDTTMAAMLHSLGLQQFKSNFTGAGPDIDDDNFKVYKIIPFAAQFVFEIIECDGEVSSDRVTENSGSSKTKYVHLILNDHTVPLGQNLELCSERKDGWCEYEAFMKHLDGLYEEAHYDEICYE